MRGISGRAVRASLTGAVLLALSALFTGACAQKWPERPVRIVIAAGPGGGDDFVTRLIAPRLAELLGQQFIAENRPGAGGIIGQSAVLKAPPDGGRHDDSGVRDVDP